MGDRIGALRIALWSSGLPSFEVSQQPLIDSAASIAAFSGNGASVQISGSHNPRLTPLASLLLVPLWGFPKWSAEGCHGDKSGVTVCLNLAAPGTSLAVRLR